MRAWMAIGALWLCLGHLPVALGNPPIDWGRLDPYTWLDWDAWKARLKEKEATPAWEWFAKERFRSELVGRVLHCAGTCRLYREGWSKVGRYTFIREGDEIETGKDGYLWAVLLDGTLVRMSPTSSLNFGEINLGESSLFIRARINFGNVLWLARSGRSYKEIAMGETDTLPLPSLAKTFPGEKSYDRLNQLVKENNQFVGTYQGHHFLVMANGTLYGKGLSVEVFALSGAESFFKLRDAKQLREDGEDEVDAGFHYRGYKNKKVADLEAGVWYQADASGEELDEYFGDRKFRMGEYLTSNIPSLLIARELWLREHSKFVFASLSRVILAEKHGYRRWRESEIAARVKFLTEYVRRAETSGLRVAASFRHRMEERKTPVPVDVWSDRFFRRALEDYRTSERWQIGL